MEDRQIIDLYWERSEAALSQTAKKYGRYCHTIAFHVLRSAEESEECVSDTYMAAWKSIPPHRPSVLKTFLGKITRNLALNRYEYLHAEKRNAGQIPLVLDELRECLPSSDHTEDVVDNIVLAELLDRFLAELSAEQRKIFMRRYWYLSSVREIAEEYGLSESKVKMSLFRSRKTLRQILEKEGIL